MKRHLSLSCSAACLIIGRHNSSLIFRNDRVRLVSPNDWAASGVGSMRFNVKARHHKKAGLKHTVYREGEK